MYSYRSATLFITVNDLNEAPTDMALSNSAIDENIDTTGGAIVGALSVLSFFFDIGSGFLSLERMC